MAKPPLLKKLCMKIILLSCSEFLNENFFLKVCLGIGEKKKRPNSFYKVSKVLISKLVEVSRRKLYIYSVNQKILHRILAHQIQQCVERILMRV